VVVEDALLLVAQDLIRLRDLAELLLVPGVLVRVILHAEFAEGGLDLAVRRLRLEVEPLIQIDLLLLVLRRLDLLPSPAAEEAAKPAEEAAAPAE